MGGSNIYSELAERIASMRRGWLPGIGKIVNITFDESEAELVERVLREASLPTLATTLGDLWRNGERA